MAVLQNLQCFVEVIHVHSTVIVLSAVFGHWILDTLFDLLLMSMLKMYKRGLL